MIHLIINDKTAVLPKNIQFELTLQNPLFGDEEGFTLAIELPVRGVKENMEIFGPIFIKGTVPDNVFFDAHIITETQELTGVLQITDFTETGVSTQFLTGQSAMNVLNNNKAEKIYISDVAVPVPRLGPRNVSPTEARKPYLNAGHNHWVAFDWVNNSSGITQNEVTTTGSWSERVLDENYLSWTPFLIFLADKYARAAGFKPDFSEWEKSDKRFLMVCNSWPNSWHIADYRCAVPRWTVAEFFSNIQVLLGGEFEWNHSAKTVTFRSNESIAAATGEIRISQCFAEFQCEVDADENKSAYRKEKNIVYAEQDDERWKFESCGLLLHRLKTLELVPLNSSSQQIVNYPTWQTFMADYQAGNCHWFRGEIYFIENSGEYYIVEHGRDLIKENVAGGDEKKVYQYWERPVEINRFGGIYRDYDEDAETMELQLSPLRQGFMRDRTSYYFWLPFKNSDSADSSQSGTTDAESAPDLDQSWIYHTIIQGEKEASQLFDRLFLAYYPYRINASGDYVMPPEGFNTYPGPLIDGAEGLENMTLRLVDKGEPTLPDNAFPGIDTTRKYSFSFLMDRIPSPRAVFRIGAKRYVCEKITASFSYNGMSQLLKGDFSR